MAALPNLLTDLPASAFAFATQQQEEPVKMWPWHSSPLLRTLLVSRAAQAVAHPHTGCNLLFGPCSLFDLISSVSLPFSHTSDHHGLFALAQTHQECSCLRTLVMVLLSWTLFLQGLAWLLCISACPAGTPQGHTFSQVFDQVLEKSKFYTQSNILYPLSKFLSLHDFYYLWTL